MLPFSSHVVSVSRISAVVGLAGLLLSAGSIRAQTPDANGASGKDAPSQSPQRPAQELISQQEPPRISPRVLETMTPDSAAILVSLSKQRAYLMSGGEIAVDSPISSGKRSRMTPTGSFKVLEKDPDHRSTMYGAFCDSSNQALRSGVSTRIDSAPSGTHFVGLPMLYFLRLNENGLGLQTGILPGYPAADGCIRLPAEIAPIFFSKVKVGTSAEIAD